MNNRHERRAAKKRGRVTTIVDYGYLLEGDPNYGLRVICYGCSARHKAFGLARIKDKSGTTVLPLCEPCLSDDSDSIFRKFRNEPDLTIREGGEVTLDQILAMAEKLDAKEH